MTGAGAMQLHSPLPPARSASRRAAWTRAAARCRAPCAAQPGLRSRSGGLQSSISHRRAAATHGGAGAPGWRCLLPSPGASAVSVSPTKSCFQPRKKHFPAVAALHSRAAPPCASPPAEAGAPPSAARRRAERWRSAAVAAPPPLQSDFHPAGGDAEAAATQEAEDEAYFEPEEMGTQILDPELLKSTAKHRPAPAPGPGAPPPWVVPPPELSRHPAPALRL